MAASRRRARGRETTVQVVCGWCDRVLGELIGTAHFVRVEQGGSQGTAFILRAERRWVEDTGWPVGVIGPGVVDLDADDGSPTATTLKLAHSIGALRCRYLCHRRCDANFPSPWRTDYTVRRDHLHAAFRAAVADGRHKIRLLDDINGVGVQPNSGTRRGGRSESVSR